MRKWPTIGSTLAQLRWLSEARTSTAAVAHTVITRGSSLVLNIGTGVLCARSLGPLGRGEQAAMGLWPVLLGGLLTFGVPTALRYYVPRRPDESGRYLSAALFYGIVLGCLAIAVGIPGLPVWLSRQPHEVVRDAQLLMLSAPAIMAMYMMQGYLEARGDFRKSNFMFSLPAVTTLLLLLVLIGAHRLSPLTCSLAYLVPPLGITTWRLVEYRSVFGFPIAGFRDLSANLFSYGLRVFGSDIVGTLSAQVDQALVVKFLAGTSLGVYTVALAVSRVLTIFQSSLIVVLFPKAASLGGEDAVALIARAARLSMAALAALALAFGVVLPLVMPLLYGSNFEPAVRVAQLLLLEATFSGTTSVLCQAFTSTGRPFVVTLLQTAGLLTAIPLMVWLIPRFGIFGAALALMISTSVRFTAILACFPLLLHRPVPLLLVNREDVRFVISRLRRPEAAG